MRKIGLVFMSSLLLIAAANADEPQRFKVQIGEDGKPVIVQPPRPAMDSDFVVQMPKDNSGFSLKPPPGAVINNPALLRRYSQPPAVVVQPRQIIGVFPRTEQDKPSTPRWFMSNDAALKAAPQWLIRGATLSAVLSQIKRSYNVTVILCTSPERRLEDVGISMMLSGTNAEEKLSSLEVLGLVWRKAGDTYYVAWNEKDLPPVAPTIMPAPQ